MWPLSLRTLRLFLDQLLLIIVDVNSMHLEDNNLPYLLPGQVQDEASHWKKPTETVTEIDLSDDLSEISLK